MTYDNTNRGVLFPNDKRHSDNSPHHLGKINVDGREFRLSAWLKTSQKGVKYMSLSVSEFETQTEAVEVAGGPDVAEEDIPF